MLDAKINKLEICVEQAKSHVYICPNGAYISEPLQRQQRKTPL
jgi:hypothetical protein